jgi:hypothetical protein
MNDVLKQRGRIYGDFEKIAKTKYRLTDNIDTFYVFADEVAIEAMDMILHKIARISNNDLGWKVIDNWRDIAGYAQLVVKHLENQQGAIDTVVEYKTIGGNNESN